MVMTVGGVQLSVQFNLMSNGFGIKNVDITEKYCH